MALTLKNLLEDLNTYSKNFVNPPKISPMQHSVWLDNIVNITINVGEKPVTRPAIVPVTRGLMHHEIIIHGPDGPITREIVHGVAEVAIREWLNHRYWSLTND